MTVTTIPPSTSNGSVDFPLPARITVIGGFILVGAAIAGVVHEPWQHRERDCRPSVELCGQADKLWVPDGPQSHPYGDTGFGDGRLAAAVSSTTASTTARMTGSVLLPSK